MNDSSVGLVRTSSHTFAHPPVPKIRDSGVELGPVSLAYET